MFGASRIDEANGLSIVDDISKLAMEESILDIKLASLPLKREREERMKWTIAGLTTGLDVSSKSTPYSWKAATHLACFVAVDGSIGHELVAKDPLFGGDVSIPSMRHKVLSVVAEESAVLHGHSIELVRTPKSTPGCWNR
jgi:hypothetical protein